MDALRDMRSRADRRRLVQRSNGADTRTAFYEWRVIRPQGPIPGIKHGEPTFRRQFGHHLKTA